MANKAFGWMEYWTTSGGVDPVYVRFKYVVLDPSSHYVGQGSARAVLDYDGDVYGVWAAVVAAVRVEESDPSMIVVPMPSGLEFLAHERSY